MTAPTLVKRQLTINFQRSVLSGTPQVMEVAIAPLTNPSAPNNDATLVGGTQRQDVLLGNENNPVYFDLVPSDASGLTDRLLYRIAWREKYLGRQYTQEFVMPDFDCAFDDLQDLGNIIGGETYVQWADRLRPGGVAGLDQSGRVIDSTGVPITGAEAAAAVQGNLDAEVVARQQGDAFLRSYFLQFAEDQITALYTTVANNMASQVNQLQNADLTEKTARASADAALNADVTGLEHSTATAFASVNEDIADITEVLTLKADLDVNGKVRPEQVPDIAIAKAVNVANEAAMLALTATQVQQGDFAVRPDGIFFLNTSPPSNINNWVKFSVVSTVTKVNNKVGDVVLVAADVGARPASDPIPQADVTGLTTALLNKTDVAITTNLTGRVSAIESDPTIVKTVGGYIPHTLNDDRMAYVNASGQVTKKDGTVLSFGTEGGGGETGGTVAIADVTGLQTVLDSKAGVSDPRFTDTRTPKTHAASHAAGQPDALTPAAIGARASATPIPLADVTGLNAILTNNGLTSTSDLDGQLAALTTQVNSLLPVAITSVTGLNTALNSKADGATTTTALTHKADLDGGNKVPITQLPDYSIAKVTGLQAALDNKIELSGPGTTVPLSQLPSYPTSKVTGLDAALGNMVALGPGGKLLTSQLPPEAIVTITEVANRGSMLLLTAQPGDIASITSTTDKGTYVLQGTDPTVFTNWIKQAVPDDAVQSINGLKGAVVLTAADVGARSSATSIAQAEVTGLTTALGNKADQAAMTTALAGKTSPADVEAKITQSSQNKPQAGLVATSSIPSLSGQQSLDGVLAPLGTVVLVTAQPSSANNGLYQVASGSWPRIAEMFTNDYFVRGTIVTVSGGTAHHDSFWQQTNASGYVGTNANNWTKVMTAGAPPTLTASLGVKKVINDFQAAVVAGGGIQAVAGGLQLDPTVALRKVPVDVPASGSTTVIIPHNLGTTDIAGASFRDKASGDAILLGWKPSGANAISAEFDAPPAAGQWRCVISG